MACVALFLDPDTGTTPPLVPSAPQHPPTPHKTPLEGRKFEADLPSPSKHNQGGTRLREHSTDPPGGSTPLMQGIRHPSGGPPILGSFPTLLEHTKLSALCQGAEPASAPRSRVLRVPFIKIKVWGNCTKGRVTFQVWRINR